MAFIRKLPDTPERLEHLKGGAGHLERYALLSPEEMLGAGTVCARMVLRPAAKSASTPTTATTKCTTSSPGTVFTAATARRRPWTPAP